MNGKQRYFFDPPKLTPEQKAAQEYRQMMADCPPTFLSERQFKTGYIIRLELHENDGTAFPLKSAYNYDGYYIGSPRDAKFLCDKLGIKPEPIHQGKNICTIGYSESRKKYYGWSHRAVVGFKIGQKIFDPKFGSHLPEAKRDKIKFSQHGKKTIRNMKDLRQCAANFAEYVG